MNNIQPSCVVGQPLKQLTMNGHIQAERNCTAECIFVLYDLVLANHVSSEITDYLVNTSVMSCRNSIIVEPSTRERARNSVRKNNYKSQCEREPSRVCVKKLHKMFHSKCSRKRLRCALNANFPKSSFIRKIIMNYKYYQMKYVSDNFYSKYVFFFINVRKEKKTSTINRKDLVSQSEYLTAIYSLSGGMYSGTTYNNFTWNILVNKLASIGRVPFDCASSSGDCFFASMGHSLYSNADLHVQIRSAGITHMINHPELYIESVAYESREHYIQEMSKQGTWCDNIIIQAVANALSCTIHINDSDLNAINPTIITPLNSHQKQRIVFLGYINDLHYVSTLQDSQNQNAVKIISSIKRKVSEC